MLRSFLGLTAATLIAVACGSDDGKKAARAEGAGAGGDAGAPSSGNGGGSDSNEASQGGSPTSSLAGAGRDAAGGGATGLAGAPSGGTPSSAGQPAVAGPGGEGGAAGAGATPVSLDCEPGEYNAGEGGCLTCEDQPSSIELTCTKLFDAVLVSDSGPLWIRFYPPSGLREPLPGNVTVSYRTGDSLTEVEYPLLYDHVDGFWQLDVTADSSLATEEVHVRPFTVRTACGDTVALTDDIVFVQAEPNTDSYELVCAD
jgi:hypothetical protein